MFREMRKSKRQMSEEETVRTFEKGTFGTLALLGDDDYPYAVPVNFVYDKGKLFFHGAAEGHKTDAVKKCSKASFCVVGEAHVISEKYSTCFQSAIAFGRIRVVEDGQEKREALKKLTEKYVPDNKEESMQRIEQAVHQLCIIELSIEHMTGKESSLKA